MARAMDFIYIYRIAPKHCVAQITAHYIVSTISIGSWGVNWFLETGYISRFVFNIQIYRIKLYTLCTGVGERHSRYTASGCGAVVTIIATCVAGCDECGGLSKLSIEIATVVGGRA